MNSSTDQKITSHTLTRSPVVIPVSRRLLVPMSVGVAGTVLFAVLYFIEGATRPGYNAMQQTISSLSIGPDGWIQRANFMLCGLGVLLLAVVWRAILKGGPGAAAYPILRIVEGLGLIWLGIFTTDPVHTAGMVVTMVAMCMGLFVIARRFWVTPGLRGLAVFTVACGIWPNVVLPCFGMAMSPVSPLHPYGGLLERLATGPDILWGVTVLIALWTGTRLMPQDA